MNMKEFVLILASVGLLSLDGIMALYNAIQSHNHRNRISLKKDLIEKPRFLELYEEIALINTVGKVRFPSVVTSRKGYSGRGNPLLARLRNLPINVIDKRIERIIR